MQDVYGRVNMLCKLKYAGISTKGLKEIYCLFIRSKAEFCSVVFALRLTLEQKNELASIENMLKNHTAGNIY